MAIIFDTETTGLKKYIIFSQNLSSEFLYTQENPLTENQIINLFWKKYKILFKNKKDVSLKSIQEKTDLSIENISKFNKKYVLMFSRSKKLKRHFTDEDVMFFDKKCLAERSKNENLEVVKYSVFLTKKETFKQKIYKKNLLQETKCNLTKDDWDFFNKQNLDKDKFFVFSTIINKEVKDSNLELFIEDTKTKFNNLRERFNQYQLMALFGMCEKSIYNLKKLSEKQG